MELSDIRPIVEFYHSKLSQVSLDFKRYLYPQINWDSSVIGIKGERGVGKTTMLLQRIKEKYKNPDDTFYISLDHYWFGTHELQDLIKFMYKRGITEFYIDEVHKYKGWSTILKNLVDELQDLRIVYTGSSLLEIDNAKVDMSRRQTPYTLKGMSFREYLELRPGDKERRFVQYLRYGGLPDTDPDRGDRHSLGYLEGVFNTVLIKDVLARLKTDDVNRITAIARFLYSNIGNVTNIASIAKVDADTVRKILKRRNIITM